MINNEFTTRLDSPPNINGVLYITEVLPENREAGSNYIRIRQKEGRIYGDAVVSGLPGISRTHPHYKEWLIRKRSARKLISYISQRRNLKDILDLGCGNGWLSSMLAEIDGTSVTGIDVNVTELEQAARVFKKSSLIFAYGDIFNPSLSDLRFDFIILSGVIQYFSDLKKLMRTLIGMLNTGGEIHILDSPFYESAGVEQAKKRSKQHFERMGMPQMTNFFHHHLYDDLNDFSTKILYDPDRIINRIRRKLSGTHSPFPWIAIIN